MAYELFYWPSIQGRGEFVRLALEAAGAPYVDVARERGTGRGVKALMAMLEGRAAPFTPFAPPILRDGETVVSHVANILLYLGPKLGLAPAGEAARLFAHGLELTITDFVAEIHDTHHPISTELYYEDQKKEAKARTGAFLAHRAPKYLGYFEQVLNDNPAGKAHAVGDKLTTEDLSLFQVWAGLSYAFPRAFAGAGKQYPALAALVAEVAAHPKVAAYLASERRIPFNETGVFRCYPALDEGPPKAGWRKP
jgi:glutathione S-transferase